MSFDLGDATSNTQVDATNLRKFGTKASASFFQHHGFDFSPIIGMNHAKVIPE